MTSVARLPKLVVMNNEVEIDTRHEVISSIEGSSLPWTFFCEEKGGDHQLLFLPAALKASFAKTSEASQSRTGTRKAEMFGSGFFLSFVTYLAPIGSRGEQ